MSDRVTYREVFRRIPSAVRAMDGDEKAVLVFAVLVAACSGAVMLAGGFWGLVGGGLGLGTDVMLVFMTIAASGYRRKFEQIRDGREHSREN